VIFEIVGSGSLFDHGIALIEVDGAVPDDVAAAVAKLPLVKHAKPLAF